MEKQKPHHPSEKKSERKLVIKSSEGLIRIWKKKQKPHHPSEREREKASHKVFWRTNPNKEEKTEAFRKRKKEIHMCYCKFQVRDREVI